MFHAVHKRGIFSVFSCRAGGVSRHSLTFNPDLRSMEVGIVTVYIPRALHPVLTGDDYEDKGDMTDMIACSHPNGSFLLRVAGVLIDNGKVLMQRNKSGDAWVLPGLARIRGILKSMLARMYRLIFRTANSSGRKRSLS